MSIHIYLKYIMIYFKIKLDIMCNIRINPRTVK